MPGPVPKRESQRRRRNKPASHPNGAESVQGAVTAPAELGFDAHVLVADLWRELSTSVEAAYYSRADWQRVRLELWYLDQIMSSGRAPGSQAWVAVQAGLNSLLVSPADKRRIGIELQSAKVDEDEAAANATVTDLHARFGA